MRDFAVVAIAAFFAACATAKPHPGPVELPKPPDRPQPTPGDGTLGPLLQTQMRAHYIDVGQGDATLLEFPCAAVLIDTGGEKNDLYDSRDALGRYLKGFFERRKDLENTLALLVITHPHIDHTRGTKTVVDRFTVSNIVDNGREKWTIGGPQQTLLHELAKNSGGKVRHRGVALADIPAKTGLTGPIIDPVKCDAVDPLITALWGRIDTDPGWTKHAFKNENNHSVALRIGFGDSSFLFTGDLESEGIEGLLAHYAGSELLDTDVYQVGHHGSYNGTTAELVEAMTPRMAVFSFGPFWREKAWTAWRFGHPRQQVVRMLQAGVSGTRPEAKVQVATAVRAFETWPMTKAVYATGWDGTVVVLASSDGTIEVEHTAGNKRPEGSAPGDRPALVSGMSSDGKIDLNAASAKQLTSLPGIGPALAARIVAYARATGFTSVQDLRNVRGIGTKTLAKIAPLVTVLPRKTP